MTAQVRLGIVDIEPSAEILRGFDTTALITGILPFRIKGRLRSRHQFNGAFMCPAVATLGDFYIAIDR